MLEITSYSYENRNTWHNYNVLWIVTSIYLNELLACLACHANKIIIFKLLFLMWKNIWTHFNTNPSLLYCFYWKVFKVSNGQSREKRVLCFFLFILRPKFTIVSYIFTLIELNLHGKEWSRTFNRFLLLLFFLFRFCFCFARNSFQLPIAHVRSWTHWMICMPPPPSQHTCYN